MRSLRSARFAPNNPYPLTASLHPPIRVSRHRPIARQSGNPPCPTTPGSVSNGDFSQFAGTDTATYMAVGAGSSALTGWTVAGAVVRIRSGNAAWQHTTAISGDYYTCLHSTVGGSISTMLTGMEVGAAYTVAWHERDRVNYQSRQLAVRIGGCDGTAIEALHTVPGDWAQRTASFTATATATRLCFETPGGTADGSVFLDSISAFAACTYSDGPVVSNDVKVCQDWVGTLSEAKRRCDIDSGCTHLHDFASDGQNWRVCSAVLEQSDGGAKTKIKSCTGAPLFTGRATDYKNAEAAGGATTLVCQFFNQPIESNGLGETPGASCSEKRVFAHNDCPAGTEEVSVPSSSADRVCRRCGSGRFAPDCSVEGAPVDCVSTAVTSGAFAVHLPPR